MSVLTNKQTRADFMNNLVEAIFNGIMKANVIASSPVVVNQITGLAFAFHDFYHMFC